MSNLLGRLERLEDAFGASGRLHVVCVPWWEGADFAREELARKGVTVSERDLIVELVRFSEPPSRDLGTSPWPEMPLGDWRKPQG